MPLPAPVMKITFPVMSYSEGSMAETPFVTR
jgi:hypothetical protein